MKPSSSATASATLAVVWSGCFILALTIPFLLLVRANIEGSTLPTALEQISTLYAPHFGTVLAFYFANPARRGRGVRVKSGSFFAALIASAVWNVVVTGTLLLVPLGVLRIEDALSYAGSTGPKLSWLVAPALGYFFARPAEAGA